MSQRLVLFLADSLSQADDLSRLNLIAKPDTVQFRYPPSIGTEVTAPDGLLADCKTLLEDESEGIDAVIALNPANDLVASALVQDCRPFTKLRGPSFESVLLVSNEYYNKILLLDGFNIPFESLKLEDTSADTLGDKIQELGGNVVVKCGLQGTSGDQVIAAGSDLDALFILLQDINRATSEHYRPLIAPMLPRDRYPMVFEPFCILQPDWGLWQGDFTHHDVEACVVEGEFVPWAIVDLVFASCHGRQVMKYARLPSLLSETSQMNIWATCGVVAQRMISHGFDCHFFHMHVICTKNDDVQVVHLSTGIVGDSTRMYLHVLNQGNNFKALMDLKLGRSTWTPKPLPQRLAIRAELWCFATDVQATEVYDFKAAKLNPNIETVVLPEAELNDGLGTLLAHVHLKGKNEKECSKQLLAALEAVCQQAMEYNWVFIKGQRELLIPATTED